MGGWGRGRCGRVGPEGKTGDRRGRRKGKVGIVGGKETFTEVLKPQKQNKKNLRATAVRLRYN